MKSMLPKYTKIPKMGIIAHGDKIKQQDTAT